MSASDQPTALDLPMVDPLPDETRKYFDVCEDTLGMVPNVLRCVETVDLSATVLGQKLAMPFYCSPTALQRLFHHQGERAVAAAAAENGTMFGVSSFITAKRGAARDESYHDWSGQSIASS